MAVVNPITSVSPMIDGANVTITRVYQPEVDLNNEKKYICYQGAKEVSYAQTRANSFTPSQDSWTIYVPSLRSIVDRRMYMKYTVTLTITNAVDIAGLGSAASLGIRQFPLHAASTSVTVDLGGAKLSWNSRQQVHALSRINLSEYSRKKFGGVAYPDQYPNLLNAGARNPFAPYETNQNEDTRNFLNQCVQMVTYKANRGAANATIFMSPDDPYTPLSVGAHFPAGTKIVDLIFTVYEPFFLSPFVLDEYAPGLQGVSQININFNIADLRLMFEGAVQADPENANYVYSVSVGALGAAGVQAGFDATMYTCFYTQSAVYPPLASNLYTIYDTNPLLQ